VKRKFNIGDEVFISKDAEDGKMASFVIRHIEQVMFVDDNSGDIVSSINYTPEGTNKSYSQDELCTLRQAQKKALETPRKKIQEIKNWNKNRIIE